eukprot:SAG31_NODE_3869_length_3799_cov_1.602432_2_plen_254_part_00
MEHPVRSGANAFYLACEQGHDEVAKWLSDERGTETSTVGASGLNVLEAACRCDRLNVVRWLVESKGMRPTQACEPNHTRSGGSPPPKHFSQNVAATWLRTWRHRNVLMTMGFERKLIVDVLADVAESDDVGKSLLQSSASSLSGDAVTLSRYDQQLQAAAELLVNRPAKRSHCQELQVRHQLLCWAACGHDRLGSADINPDVMESIALAVMDSPRTWLQLGRPKDSTLPWRDAELSAIEQLVSNVMKAQRHCV